MYKDYIIKINKSHCYLKNLCKIFTRGIKNVKMDLLYNK